MGPSREVKQVWHKMPWLLKLLKETGEDMNVLWPQEVC